MTNSTVGERRKHLTPTALSQYVGLDNCDRYLRFYLHQAETERLTRRLANQTEMRGTPWIPVQPLSPLLTEVGDRTERDVIASLTAQGHQVQDLANLDAAGALDVIRQFIELCASEAQSSYFYQVPMRGTLGRWPFEGRADLVRVQIGTDGPEFLVIDIKASRKDKVQHRLQVAVYVLMLQQMLAQVGSAASKFEGAIVRRTADSTLQDPAHAPTFELAPYLDTIRHLTEGPHSPLERVDAVADFRQLHYYLGPRCDGCAFGPVCLTESAERRDLSLIPFLESSDKRVLNQLGITNLEQLVALKQFVTHQSESGKPKTRLEVAPGQEKLIEKLSQQWPLAPRLDRLIQRAAVNLRHFDKTTPARRFFVDRTAGSGRRGGSNLPDDKLYPDLIKIFVDVQADYLEDHLYLAGALVTQGDKVEAVVIRTTPTVPTAESERALLIEWVGAVFAAIAKLELFITEENQVASFPEMQSLPTSDVVFSADSAVKTSAGVRVHLYLYNRRDQQVLLDALRRHLDAFAAMPAFYYLLTDTPALTQPAIAFLYDEIRERLNLPGPLSSLAVVSRQLGFKWQETRTFRAGFFDYGLRRNDGVWLHTAARFYSGLPLEYAYAAWDKLPKMTKAYAGVTITQIEEFAAQRLHALAHIEASFPYKNSFLQKEPIHLLPSSSDTPFVPARLAQVLEEFLHIEQYTHLQQHLELFARPVVRRMEEGRALLVRCTEMETTPLSRRRKQMHATFLIELDRVNIYSQTAIQVCKLKEGDFVTLTPLEDDAQPWKIVGGRLARIEEISGGWVKLELSGSTLGQGQHSAFRYFHARDLLPQPGAYYTIDEMVDNLNGDKLVEACHHAEGNTLYKYATQPAIIEATTSADSVAAYHKNAIEIMPYFLAVVTALETEQGRAPTADQLNVIGGHLAGPLFLVQGPPGTGKSHTLGWAVLARVWLALVQAAQNGQATPTFRVIVSSQTHNAVEIVLESIASKWQQILDFATTLALADENQKVLQAGLQDLKHLKIYKAGGDEKAARPVTITYLDPWYREQVKAVLGGEVFEPNKPKPKPKASPAKASRSRATSQLPPTPQLLIIGATPGNLYNLMKEYYGRGKTKQNQVWDEADNKFFDLLVLDEASQMNLPHALLAAGWLKPTAPVLVVGDHRQLAPILAHGWEHEEHLPTVGAKPYRSVFQYFLDSGWPRVALSESFRLHSTQAAFLAEHIYQQDGVSFHSRRQNRLPALWPDVNLTNPVLEAFLQAVLHPDYPVIVIEHNEAASLQYNETELDIISPIIKAAINRLGLEGKDGIGVVVPHRAQKAALRERFPVLAQAGAIDTVERFQGAERDLIIVSTTASDPDYVAAEAEFLLSPNRFNVALSRPRAKLIVVASSSIFQFVSARLELFEQALLWKKLAARSREQTLWSGQGSDVFASRLPQQPHADTDRRSGVRLQVFGF